MQDGSGGSPFQWPTRLADGLGLESGLNAQLPAVLRPVPEIFRETGSPACGLRKEAAVRLRGRECRGWGGGLQIRRQMGIADCSQSMRWMRTPNRWPAQKTGSQSNHKRHIATGFGPPFRTVWPRRKQSQHLLVPLARFGECHRHPVWLHSAPIGELQRGRIVQRAVSRGRRRAVTCRRVPGCHV